MLSVTLECPAKLGRKEILDVTVKVTYRGLSEGAEQQARPITFHKYGFEVLSGPREGFRLYRRRDTAWEACEDEEEPGFAIMDDPDVEVHVGQDENFASLEPGESWTTSRRIQGETWSSLPDDTAVGDVFRYRSKGATVDWWDWGSREEHAETVVKLPCWIAGPVADPAGNGGWPKLVVPASDVQFSIAA